MLIMAIAFAFMFLAYWTRSSFIHLIGGFVVIAAGINFISLDTEWIYTVVGVSMIFWGLYEMLMIPYNMVRRD